MGRGSQCCSFRTPKHHDRIVLDWGFPTRCLPWVEELQKCGVKLVWFAGDIDAARKMFVQRGGIAVEMFDTQVTDIRIANFPALTQLRDRREIVLDRCIFG